MMSVFGVEASVIDEIDATADDVTRGESRSVRLPSTGRAKRMTVVTVITVRVLIPTGEAIHIDPLGRQTDSHVPAGPWTVWGGG